MTYMSITLSHGSTQYQWSERKQILTIVRAIFEHTDAYYRGPQTFIKEKSQLNWQGLLERSVQYAIFFLPITLKVSWNREMNKLFVSGCLPGRVCKPANRKRFLL